MKKVEKKTEKASHIPDHLTCLLRNLYAGQEATVRTGHGQTGDGKSNINISGISELKGMGMVEFNSDDHYIYYCRQDSLRRNGVALIVNKIVQNSVWVQSQKRTE